MYIFHSERIHFCVLRARLTECRTASQLILMPQILSFSAAPSLLLYCFFCCLKLSVM
jgi:hypothetical protein